MGPARGSFVKGGVGALTAALASAAKSFGAEIRTGAEVAQVRIEKGRATGVVLSSGEEIAAGVVVSNADPKRTLLGLVDPMHLDPDFLVRIRNYRCFGVAAKVNFALSGLPRFGGLSGSDAETVVLGRPPHRSRRGLPGARFRRGQVRPVLTGTVHSRHDPVGPGSRPRSVRGARALRVRAVRAVLAGEERLGDRGGAARRRGHGDAHAVCARFPAARGAPAGHHAARPRVGLRVDRRPHLPRGARPGSAVPHAARSSAGPATARRSTASTSAAPGRTPAAA